MFLVFGDGFEDTGFDFAPAASVEKGDGLFDTPVGFQFGIVALVELSCDECLVGQIGIKVQDVF